MVTVQDVDRVAEAIQRACVDAGVRLVTGDFGFGAPTERLAERLVAEGVVAPKPADAEPSSAPDIDKSLPARVDTLVRRMSYSGDPVISRDLHDLAEIVAEMAHRTEPAYT